MRLSIFLCFLSKINNISSFFVFFAAFKLLLVFINNIINNNLELSVLTVIRLFSGGPNDKFDEGCVVCITGRQ